MGGGHKLQFNQKSLKLISPKYLSAILTDLGYGSNQVAKYGGIILSKKKDISWIDSNSFIIIQNIKANESRNAHVINVSDSFLLQIDSFRLFQQMESGRETGNVDDYIFSRRFPLWKKSGLMPESIIIRNQGFTFFLEKGSLSSNFAQGKYFAPKIVLWKLGKPSNTTFSRYGGTNTPVWDPPLQKSLLNRDICIVL